ncbi:NAD-dependent epimerase/dehydratase family protein [Aristophania vespae]|uniref:NAD-dependent epimerase/dehydratase family protein n=1 Tax=Aristophania vespae TaxID=2697033 RepID=A0A6P1NIU7_9PROT|nr:NAD-dependent epimerase/dehydratase family protein [Aristophania vespae]
MCTICAYPFYNSSCCSGWCKALTRRAALFARSNFEGLVSLLEASLTLKQINHIVYASSSAVYGRTKEFPFKETNPLVSQALFMLLQSIVTSLQRHIISEL